MSIFFMRIPSVAKLIENEKINLKRVTNYKKRTDENEIVRRTQNSQINIKIAG